jgi:hypothetical protein
MSKCGADSMEKRDLLIELWMAFIGVNLRTLVPTHIILQLQRDGGRRKEEGEMFVVRLTFCPDELQAPS